MRRNRTWRVLAGFLTCATLFQVQCNLTSDQVGALLVQDVATILISGFVNDQFGVQTFGF